MTDNTPVIDWDAVRARYEGRDETTTVIAASIGVWQSEVSRQARLRGWVMRKPQQVKAGSTTETLRRLKDRLQQRLGQFEGEMKDLGEKITALKGAQDIRDTSTLLRTLEKVLELELRHKKRQSRSARETARLNDAQRDELARRIEGLRVEQPDAEPQAEDQRGAGTPGGMAPVGEGGSASA